jgi:hypothetical protein
MNIVIGRGKKRQVIELPTGEIMAASAKHDPESYKAGLAQLCGLLKVPA